MKIAVDLDDVVLSFIGGVLAAVKKEYDVTVDPESITKFEWADTLDPILGMSWWTWLRQHDWIWKNFPAVDGALGGLRTLRRNGHYLVCVTSKPEWAEASVWQWLGLWRPPFHSVVIVGPKDVKADFSDADILVDDKPDNCYAWAATGRDAILFDRPHNRSAVTTTHPSKGHIIRAEGWGEVLEQIRLVEEPEA